MELNEAYRLIEKGLSSVNEELGFQKTPSDETNITFSGPKGMYRLSHDAESNILSFECAYENNGADTAFNTISKSLFEPHTLSDRDLKSTVNEIEDELSSLFRSRKKVDLDKVKMPKAVSRTKAKSGIINYDTDSLANRFGTLYPEQKKHIKANIAAYGEFLPETFFAEYGTAKVLDVIKNGSEAERKKLFKMLNEVYEDGTNEVQDIIGVSILGEMKGDRELMAIADEYMIEYMSGPVHEINKITAKKNSYTKKLKNPPAYKPKKKKRNSLQNALNQTSSEYNR